MITRCRAIRIRLAPGNSVEIPAAAHRVVILKRQAGASRARGTLGCAVGKSGGLTQ